MIDPEAGDGSVEPLGSRSIGLAVVDGTSLAWVTTRHGGPEVALLVHACGPDAAALAEKVAVQLRAWARDHRGGRGPQYLIYPAGTPDAQLPAADRVVGQAAQPGPDLLAAPGARRQRPGRSAPPHPRVRRRVVNVTGIPSSGGATALLEPPAVGVGSDSWAEFDLDVRVAGGSLRVLVVGQGYVGLPLAIRAAQMGHRVVGLDSDRQRAESLACGTSPVEDISSAQLGLLLRDGVYRPTSSPDDAAGFDVAVIAVPTPLREGVPDLSYVLAAGRTVGRFLREGALVVLESTSYPGTTRNILGPVLEEVSGLLMGSQFALGFSPERIDPGNRLWTLETTPKIVSGIDPASLERTAAFYAELVDRVVPVSRCEEAELAKLLENTFRAVNIALVNELAEVARDTGLDLREALAAAETKPFGFMRFDPGPGIGGHCLPIDPVYLSWWAEQARGRGSRMIELAAHVNAARPAYVVNRVGQYLADRGLSLAGAQVLLLGLGYKRGSGDFRESPALEVARLLAGHGAQVSAADPFVDPGTPLAALDNVRLVVATAGELTAADAVVLLTDHDDFDYDRVAACSPFVLDCRGRLASHLTATVEQL